MVSMGRDYLSKDTRSESSPRQGCDEPSPDETHKYNNPRSLSTTAIVDVSNMQRVPLVVVNFVALILSLVAFWSSIFLLIGRDVPAETAYGGHRIRSLVIAVIQRPELPMIPLSAFMFFTASFGFLGGLRENVCFLTTNVVLLTIITLSLVLASAAAIVLPPIARNYAKKSMSTELILAYRESEDIESIVDWFQIEYRCCGVTTDSYRDWSLNPYFKCDKDNLSKERCSVPYSCCRKNESDIATLLPNVMCGAKVLQGNEQKAWSKVYTRSCADAVFISLQENTVYVVAACTMACLLTMLMAVFALSVRSEVLMLSAIYEVYYKHVLDGQRRMTEEHGRSLSVSEPKEPLSVAERLIFLTRHWFPGGDEKEDGGDTTKKTGT